MKISEIEINIDSSLWAIIGMIKYSLSQMQYPDVDKIIDTFTQHYKKLLQEHEQEDHTDLARYYRLISVFKPALDSILKPGPEYDQLCDFAISQFNVVLDRIRREVNEDNHRKKKIRGPTLPGSGKSINLKYFCTVCKQEFEIPVEMQTKLLNSDYKMELPKHCDSEMQVRIVHPKKEDPIKKKEESKKKIEIYPAEVLMGHIDSKESNVEYLKLVSVGIDIGSSTSHLIFSQLTFRKEVSFFNMTNRFNLVDREIIHEGDIIFTPLIDSNTIDIEAIIQFCKEEYKKAGFTPEMVDTG
ncbi:MAG: ethanolamine ammonia-lyase reactivating factor EutA, partial [Promethearchaeota archaeon]